MLARAANDDGAAFESMGRRDRGGARDLDADAPGVAAPARRDLGAALAEALAETSGEARPAFRPPAEGFDVFMDPI